MDLYIYAINTLKIFEVGGWVVRCKGSEKGSGSNRRPNTETHHWENSQRRNLEAKGYAQHDATTSMLYSWDVLRVMSRAVLLANVGHCAKVNEVSFWSHQATGHYFLFADSPTYYLANFKQNIIWLNMVP